MMKMVIFSAFLGSSLLSISVFSWASPPNQKAYEIAQNQPNLMHLMKKLEFEANQIGDAQFRKDALSILQGPTFLVLEARKKNSVEISRKLQKAHLYAPSAIPLFPHDAPMNFLAAPGSVWLHHHSYPGGLVYHTITNLRVGTSYAEVYEDIYGVKLRNDYIRLAAIWHDAAKTFTIPWNADGSCSPQEALIAKTSAHHIFAVAEAIYRKYPTEFIVTLASAHNPPLAGQSLNDLIGYLQAGAIVAGQPFIAAGLTADGTRLAALPPIEAFINHLDDHDYVLTETSIAAVEGKLNVPVGVSDFWKRDEALSQNGDLPLYQHLGLR
jgi:hypothetical protein